MVLWVGLTDAQPGLRFTHHERREEGLRKRSGIGCPMVPRHRCRYVWGRVRQSLPPRTARGALSSLQWFVSEVLRAKSNCIHCGVTFRICDYATMKPLMEFSSLEAMSDYFGVKVER